MTAFEYLVLGLLFIIILAIIFCAYLTAQEVYNICKSYSRLDSKLQNTVEYLGELTDVVDKMHRNLCVEIADKMVDRAYKQPTSVNGTPCYAPDGICTNPCMDCINCPKRGTGSTWSTSTNINKKD